MYGTAQPDHHRSIVEEQQRNQDPLSSMLPSKRSKTIGARKPRAKNVKLSDE
jgi:hypothetical protein